MGGEQVLVKRKKKSHRPSAPFPSDWTSLQRCPSLKHWKVLLGVFLGQTLDLAIQSPLLCAFRSAMAICAASWRRF